MHGAPFGEVARQSAPRAAGALQIENGTRHRTSPPGVALCVYGYFPKEGGGGNCVRLMSLDTAARIVAFFHGRIRVLHTLRINNQESGCFMAPLLAALRNYLIFLMLPQGC